MSGKKQERAAGASPGARRASGEAPGAERGRFSSKRKAESVLRLLRGEELDALSRELGVTAATLSSWRDDFLAGGQANLKSRVEEPADDQSQQLKTLIGELTIDNECLRALLRKHEERDLLAQRRSRP
jgi:transposase-like protein